LIRQIIPSEIMCPAAGQGALGIEIREGDAATRELLAFLNDPNARATTTCERALLNSLGGGCQVPIGAFAEVRLGKQESRENREGHEFTRAETSSKNNVALAAGALIHLESIVADPDGSKVLRDSRDGDDPENLGNEAGAALLKRGGDAILEAVYDRGLAVPPQP
jgi:hydroxymethylbilane synthase